MSTTTDRHGPRGRKEDLDAKTDVGPATGQSYEQPGLHETEEFDREINLRGVLMSGLGVVAAILVSAFLMWWLLRGIGAFDARRDPVLTPVQQANPQPPPPEPRLEVSPPANLSRLRAEEDVQLNHAAQGGSTLRVPVDVAIDAIVRRGVAPFGAASAVNPDQARAQQEIPNPADNRKPGATMQNTQPPAAAAPAPRSPPM
jgi:hypothetical protein